jgi:hypothetical protein
LSQLARRALDEVRNPLLRHEPFVDVIVTGVHHVDTVADEQRLECDPQLDLGTVTFTVGIQRVMEVCDLPSLFGFSEECLEPA